MRKQPRTNRYQLSKLVPTTNCFEGLEEELDDKNNNIRVETTTKSPPIFVARINNFLSLSQLLKKVATDEFIS